MLYLQRVAQTFANAMKIFPIVFAWWQQYIRQKHAVSGNGKEFFTLILDLDADPDHHQNLITSKLPEYVGGTFAACTPQGIQQCKLASGWGIRLRKYFAFLFVFLATFAEMLFTFIAMELSFGKMKGVFLSFQRKILTVVFYCVCGSFWLNER